MEDITFRHAGLSPIDENGKTNNTKAQLLHFYHSLLIQGWKGRSRPKNWLEAFFLLEQHLQAIDNGERQVVFIDELPWMDTSAERFHNGVRGILEWLGMPSP